MATTWEFLVSCEENRAALAETALAEAHAVVAEFENALTEFRSTSPIYRLNAAQVGERVELLPPARELLTVALRMEELTGGAFSCSAKSTRPGRTQERFGFDEGHAWKLEEGAHLGFGAIGKGYALDRARERLERLGFGDFLISAGGSSLIFSGHAGPGKAWSWGWSWSRDATGAALGIPLAHVSGKTLALGVSGTHEKGQHLLDPRSGARVDGLRSALVAHASAAWADALSTAVFVLGWPAGLEQLRAVEPQPAVAVIDSRGVPHWNGIFEGHWPGAFRT